MRPPAERFWSKVDRVEGCWTWPLGKTADGYGRVKIGGRDKRAHRAAYEFAVGPIPPQMELDHICHNRACVRPDHLRLVTRKQNCENASGARPSNPTGVRGVSWRPDISRWIGRVGHNGHRYTRSFRSLEDAQEYVAQLRLELFTHNDADRIAA